MSIDVGAVDGREIGPASLGRLYGLMAQISVADGTATEAARSGELKAAYYPVRGLEAVCGAIGLCLDERDYLVSTYRNLGDAVAKSVPLTDIVAEYFGRTSGTSKGQGGPMHLVDNAHGLMATSGIVGGGIPIATGLGLAAMLDGNDQVVVVTFGDGATSIGAFHEGLNLAELWKLPIVFVCQNNQWGEHTALDEYSPIPTMARRADAYGMRAATVDGFDAVATLRAMQQAVHHARSGGGPTLLECVTYRLTPHVATAEMSYMPKDDLDAALTRDPLPTLRRWLLDQHILGELELDALDGTAVTIVTEAFQAASKSVTPDPDDLLGDVFADPQMVPGR